MIACRRVPLHVSWIVKARVYYYITVSFHIFCWVLLPPPFLHTHTFFWPTFLPAMSRPWENSDSLQLKGGFCACTACMNNSACLCVWEILVYVHAWSAFMHDWPCLLRDLCVFCMWVCSCMADVCVSTFNGLHVYVGSVWTHKVSNGLFCD